jgi:hypothetical protein
MGFGIGADLNNQSDSDDDSVGSNDSDFLEVEWGNQANDESGGAVVLEDDEFEAFLLKQNARKSEVY